MKLYRTNKGLIRQYGWNWIGMMMTMMSAATSISCIRSLPPEAFVPVPTSTCSLSPHYVGGGGQRHLSTLLNGRGRGKGKSDEDSKISKGKRKGDLPEKICVVCGRPFTWRAKWEKVWDEVKYCSDRCRIQRGSAKGGAGEDGQHMNKRSNRPADTSGSSSSSAASAKMMLSRRNFSSGLTALATGLLLGGGNDIYTTPTPTRRRIDVPSAIAAEKARRPAPGEIEKVLVDANEEGWPKDIPFIRSDFARLDERDDSLFYDTPKLVEHIDDQAIQALTQYYDKTFQQLSQQLYSNSQRNLDILDVGSSWVSHFPSSYTTTGSAEREEKKPSSRVAGLGMNAEELSRNPQLTEWVVKDLNKEPRFPYDDQSFDAVVCGLSIDYLTRPISVLGEMARVLRPGGLAAVAFSNRLFITKAIAVWTGADDVDHVYTVGSFFHYGGAPQGLEAPRALDLTQGKKTGDPMYLVYAFKKR